MWYIIRVTNGLYNEYYFMKGFTMLNERSLELLKCYNTTLQAIVEVLAGNPRDDERTIADAKNMEITIDNINALIEIELDQLSFD